MQYFHTLDAVLQRPHFSALTQVYIHFLDCHSEDITYLRDLDSLPFPLLRARRIIEVQITQVREIGDTDEDSESPREITIVKLGSEDRCRSKSPSLSR
ncbi:hypothetical protein OBBRIDRAFT_798517 [Obba rivulosa]|uniref:Uncharacterized protein n=1 Tax=Obba rivulosa TaxID=1052685 RepID=A0A8E2ATP6_9APHY|nr:hypothetical protein OBBRIDRAFT_798517 [Obba rivulosa]